MDECRAVSGAIRIGKHAEEDVLVRQRRPSIDPETDGDFVGGDGGVEGPRRPQGNLHDSRLPRNSKVHGPVSGKPGMPRATGGLGGTRHHTGKPPPARVCARRRGSHAIKSPIPHKIGWQAVCKQIVPSHAGLAKCPGSVHERFGHPSGRQGIVGRHLDAGRCVDGDERGTRINPGNAAGNVLTLRGKFWSIGAGQGSIRFDQCEVFALGIKFEIGMQRLSGRTAILAGGEDHQITAGVQCGGGKGPFGGIRGLVRQPPSCQIH